jgi:hypothetical protein
MLLAGPMWETGVKSPNVQTHLSCWYLFVRLELTLSNCFISVFFGTNASEGMPAGVDGISARPLYPALHTCNPASTVHRQSR